MEDEAEEEPLQAKLTDNAVAGRQAQDQTTQTKSEARPNKHSLPGANLQPLPSDGQPLTPAARGFFEPRFGADFSNVRVHNDARAQRAARDINARAFTLGHNIYLGAGQSSSDLGLMAHELTHTIQQGASPTMRAMPEAETEVEKVRQKHADPNQVQRLDIPSFGDVVEAVEGAGEAIGETAVDVGEFVGETAETVGEAAVDVGEAIGEAAVAVGERAVDVGRAAGRRAIDIAESALDTVGGIAREAWDVAKSLASVLGGVISVSGGRLVVTVPSFNPCPTISLQFTLPGPNLYVPVVGGVLPVSSDMLVFGSLGANIALMPELSVQLGPCRFHGLRIVIDPLRGNYSAAGRLSITTALGLGAEANAGVRGALSAMVMLPTFPPVSLFIPDVGLEAGLAAQARAIGVTTIDIAAAAAFSGTTFSAMLHEGKDLGLALDAGVAGYGLIDVMGVNLCRFYWPSARAGLDFGLHFEVDARLLISPLRASVALNIGPFRPISFGALPLALSRDILTDDCARLEAICKALYRLGWMPSQSGGKWNGHPSPHWPGPLPIYPRDPSQLNPGFRAGSKCRGACGPDCWTCSTAQDKFHCEPRNNQEGKPAHDIWVYPNYQECDSHKGCRDHDACYDYCSTGAFHLGTGLCSRLCDLECLCAYPPFQCAGWVIGAQPHDRTMEFSDRPRISGSCDIPCPTETGEGREGGGTGYTICLPTLELFGRLSDGDSWEIESPEYPVWRKDIIVPYVGLVTLELNASGSAEARIHGSLGPGTIENICFEVDPISGTYVARGEIKIPAQLSGSLTLTGRLSAEADWFLVVEVASATGTLSATGEAVGRATLNPTLRAEVDVNCEGGKPKLTSDMHFPRCLHLSFEMNAGFDLEALTFNIYSNSWNLFDARWERCWGESIDIEATDREPDLDLRSHRIRLRDLISWLLSDEAEEAEEAEDGEEEKTVVEDPLTTATAKTISSLSPDLNRTQYNSTTLTLLEGSSATVGDSMMTRYLTHEKTGGGSPSGQNALYGFGKLPTRSAFGGSGYGQSQVYAKGHLLNHSANRGLGGVGQPRNLYPITEWMNLQEHNTHVEEPVKELVHDDRLVVMYGVNVVNENGPHAIDVLGDGTCPYQYINADFSCTYATYKLYSDDTVALNTPMNRTVNSVFDLNGFISGVSGKGCPEG